MGFSYQKYDKVEIPFPYGGMNKDIAPSMMTEKNCYFLSNMTQESFGKGIVRYGTKDFLTIADINDGYLMRGFGYASEYFGDQIIVYASVLKQDETADTIVINNNNRLSFNTDNHEKFLKDTFIKVSYSLNEKNINQKILIKNKEDLEGRGVSLDLQDVFFEDGEINVDSIYYSEGEIYKVNVNNKQVTKVFEGLRVDCIPRAVNFVGKLIICNGLDPLLKWDGNSMSVIFEWVKENATSFSLPQQNVLRFKCNLSPEKYDNIPSVFFDSEVFIVEDTNIADDIVTLTLNRNVDKVPDQIFYKSFPPSCNFLYVFQDRLWGLGQGSASIEFRSPKEAMIVYRTGRPNSIENWVQEQTQTYFSIDMKNKHGVVDNLESIASIGSRIAFVGRKKTLAFNGLIANNTFGWELTTSTGCPHGDLVIEKSNDISFINDSGWNFFSTLNIGNQFAASGITSVNSLIRDQITDLMENNYNYRSSFSFFYDLGSFLGFRISDNNLNHAIFSNAPYFFSVFTGDFNASHAFQLGNRLYLIKDKTIYYYADGKNGEEPSYSDRGLPIVATWIQPFNNKIKNIFNCQRVRCFADYSNTFIENSENKMVIELFHERPETMSSKKRVMFEKSKDILDGAVSPIEFQGRYKTLVTELRTRGEEWWGYFSIVTKDSYFKVDKIFLYGRYDR